MVAKNNPQVTTTDKIDNMVQTAVFAAGTPEGQRSRQIIRELALASGIYPSSIQGLYDASGKGLYHNQAVPAVNIRGMTYHVAKALFRAALKNRVGAFIFEIARSEIGYTEQRPAEYAACVLAAAIREGFSGPVFLQGDHFQMNRARYGADPDQETGAIRDLIREAISADFLNIDIDASTLVDLTKPTMEEQQHQNYQVTAEMTRFIRGLQPEGIVISVGGEIGEVGKKNSTPEDLRAFMTGYLRELGIDTKGISKISVQTGTSHGGIVLPDGSIASIELDFNTLESLSRVAREEYHLGGAVQHGASTLPDHAFDLFAKVGALEVHLATGFQNIIYDSTYFPAQLREEIYRYLSEKHAAERKPGETDEQFFYENRKRAFGPFKKQMWDIPRENLSPIMETLEERFSLIFQKLNVTDTRELVDEYVVHRLKA